MIRLEKIMQAIPTDGSRDRYYAFYSNGSKNVMQEISSEAAAELAASYLSSQKRVVLPDSVLTYYIFQEQEIVASPKSHAAYA